MIKTVEKLEKRLEHIKTPMSLSIIEGAERPW
jgi:hypothetical protein